MTKKLNVELQIYILYITQVLHLSLMFYEEGSKGLSLCIYTLPIKLYTHLNYVMLLVKMSLPKIQMQMTMPIHEHFWPRDGNSWFC